MISCVVLPGQSRGILLSPTEMFGNVFTAMESLIYLQHGGESWCDIKILYNFTFEAFTNISIKTLIFASSCQIYLKC
jgi:hypothetical protein